MQHILHKPQAGMQINFSSHLARGLVGCWLFNEGSGIRAFDLGQNKNHGTLINMSIPSSRSSLGLAFDGTNDTVEVLHDNSLNLTNNFALSVWFRAGILTQTNRYILSKLFGTADNVYSIIWEYVNNSVEFYSNSFTGTAPRAGTGMVINDTNWHHIVYNYDGVNWTGHLDGVRMFAITRTFSLTATSGNVYFGNLNSAGNFFVNGTIGNVFIYKRSLSVDEIKSLYLQPYSMFKIE